MNFFKEFTAGGFAKPYEGCSIHLIQKPGSSKPQTNSDGPV